MCRPVMILNPTGDIDHALIFLYYFVMEINQQYLTVNEFANLVSLTPQYIRRLAKTKTIPASLFGNSWAIPNTVLEDRDVMFKLVKDVPDQIRKAETVPDIVALSFFSGAMGLDIGLQKAGIPLVLASEIDPSARKTILYNEPFIGLIGDIHNFDGSMIRTYANIPESREIDLIVGGPPYQAFSTAGRRKGFHDDRGNVFLTFIDRILELRPRLAIIENVRGLLSASYSESETTPKHKGGALNHIMTLLESGGYSVSFTLYNAANFGSPQKRERLVMFCSRERVSIPYLQPTHSEHGDFGLPPWRTIREVFDGLENSEHEHLHFPEKRLVYYRQLTEGQNWKNLPVELRQEAMGNSYFAQGGKTGFFRRLAWDEPSPTLVTDPTMPATDLCHPEHDRPLSIQEYMRIQEFPDEWVITGSLKDKYKQIGNAVPVSLGQAIGHHALKILHGLPIENPPEDFPFSRYANTDDRSFRRLYREASESRQLELF